MDRRAPILVCGGTGLAGGAIRRRLAAEGCSSILAPPRAELDLCDAAAVEAWFAAHRPRYVFLAAGKVGGIFANEHFPGDFIRENLAIVFNVIDTARRHGTAKLLFLGSNCLYPRLCPQPMKEEDLLSGPLEPTNRAYAAAKIAGVEMVRAYRAQYGMGAITLMPCSLYGPGDNYDAQNGHVLAALIRRFHEAKAAGAPSVVVWGTGQPRREFMHADDMAEAALFMMDGYDDERVINVGAGDDVSIAELAALVAETVGYSGEIAFDRTKPDGMPRKLLDSGRAHALGWRARTPLAEGLAATYAAFSETLTVSA